MKKKGKVGQSWRNIMMIQARLVNDIGQVTILDIGARGGVPLNEYLRYIPNCLVWAVDADPTACEGLRRMFADDNRVMVTQRAMADYEGTTKLYRHGEGRESLLPRSERWPYGPGKGLLETIPVRAGTIDHFVEKHVARPVDIIKLDIQAGELAALRGAVKTLKHVRAVFTEVMFAHQYEDCPLYHHIAQFMEDQGFYLYTLCYWSKDKKSGRLLESDALFVREGLQ